MQEFSELLESLKLVLFSIEFDLITIIGIFFGLFIANFISIKVSNYVNPIVGFKRINDNAIIPKYQTKGSAGFDFHAIIDEEIPPYSTKLISTGLCPEVPYGYELQIRCRSSIAAKTKIRVANGVGTIDSDYRGEIKIILDNISDKPYLFKKGDRIAQGVLARSIQPKIVEKDSLSKTKRGTGGFGSTGK